MPDASAFSRFLRETPKAELHVHLRGAMPLAFFQDRLRKYHPEDVLANAPPRYIELFEQFENIRPFMKSRPSLAESAAQLFRYRTFDQFLATYLFSSFFVRDAADFRALVQAVLERLAAENIVYAEITVSFIEYMQQGIALADIVSTLDDASSAGEPLRVQWILDPVRNIGPERALELLQEVLRTRPRHLVGITIGGSEHLYPPVQFVKVYTLAREAGLRRTVHAGEGLGPESVWESIRELGVERIGHGVRSIEDPALVRHLAENQIPLEVCPTSNLWTAIYPSYEAHPLKALHEAGVAVSINTDDPEFFRTSLSEEFEHAREMGLSEAAIRKILQNGFRHAFLPEDETERLANQA
ncbi:MAG: adenosine deaminase [Bryobacterales bacterium]